MDFTLRGGAPQGSRWHHCRVCPLPKSSTAPSLFSLQAATQQGSPWRGRVLSCPALALLWC